MDDITKNYLDKKLADLDKKLDGVEYGVVLRLQTVFQEGFKTQAALTNKLATELDALARAHHAEQLRKFQSVIDEAGRIGTLTALSPQLANFQLRLVSLEEKLAYAASLEARLAALEARFPKD
jgi:hypothetical protein